MGYLFFFIFLKNTEYALASDTFSIMISLNSIDTDQRRAEFPLQLRKIRGRQNSPCNLEKSEEGRIPLAT